MGQGGGGVKSSFQGLSSVCQWTEPSKSGVFEVCKIAIIPVLNTNSLNPDPLRYDLCCIAAPPGELRRNNKHLRDFGEMYLLYWWRHEERGLSHYSFIDESYEDMLTRTQPIFYTADDAAWLFWEDWRICWRRFKAKRRRKTREFSVAFLPFWLSSFQDGGWRQPR